MTCGEASIPLHHLVETALDPWVKPKDDEGGVPITPKNGVATVEECEIRTSVEKLVKLSKCFIQILPMRVHVFDQFQFPFSQPQFQ